MPIRFYCKRCRQLLSIATRKTGTEIACPKCGLPQDVPSEEAAQAAMAMLNGTQTQETDSPVAQWTVYDELPVAVKEPSEPPPPPTASGPRETFLPRPSPEPARPVPEGMILYSRRTLYTHAVLFLVVGVVGFGAGYLIGRGDASVALRAAREEALKQRVLVEGRLAYDPGSGELVGDEGAVVLALSADNQPERKLSVLGLRPQDPSPQEGGKAMRAITHLGGAYARADASGAFSLVLPQQGRYHLLLVSRHATRPAESDIEELDADVLSHYFIRAIGLIGRAQYRMSTEQFDAPAQVEFRFESACAK